ncbi:hypothetical protein ACFQ88_34415 [Paenibacillus sp. NPDC056579]|uniref:hypothetical protein n=1 Tax=Paenibacillus sp. NPDC056579 TaxID=3345871 RepID=UPI0036AA6523
MKDLIRNKSISILIGSLLVLLSFLAINNFYFQTTKEHCGTEEAYSFNFKGRVCLWNGYKLNQPAQFTFVKPSIDSGPVTYEVKIGAKQNIAIIRDSTLDGMSNRSVDSVSCSRMERKHWFSYQFVFKHCAQEGLHDKPFDLEIGL